MPPLVGKNAIALIVAEEIGSESLYTAQYQRPVWPGGGSGVTWGIGYDGGQHTAAQISTDWGPYLDPAMVALMCQAAGVTGEAAHALAPGLREVVVPIAVARTVFTDSTLPKYAQDTDDALDNCDDIPPDAFGALVSISYNRGAGGWNMDDDRHKEMAAIAAAMTAREYKRVPDLIMGMRRLWLIGGDLWKRRARESYMFANAIGI